MSPDSESPSPRHRMYAYAGPGIVEWILGLLSTVLIAETLSSLSQMEQPQTAAYYYGEATRAALLQYGQIGVCVLVLLLILGWIIGQKNDSPLQPFLLGAAALGAGLIWAELLTAKGTQPNPTFLLTDLPYHPVGSWGILGAQVFLTYMVFKLPDGKLKPLTGALLKAGFALCVWMVQLSIWGVLWRTVQS